MNALVLLIVLALLEAVCVLVLRRFALRGLQCSRQFSVPCAFEGETAEVMEIVRNDRPLLIPWLKLESRISPHLRFGRQENLGVSKEMYHRSLFMLMPYQQITRRHRVTLTHRGAYDIGNATLTAGDLLGFAAVSEERAFSSPILVWPKLLDPERLPMPLQRLMGEVSARQQLLRDPFWFNGIRAYQAGDPVRDIHWAATAKTGNIQVRTHDHTAQSRLMVIVNSQLSQHQWGQLMDYEHGLVEHAISMAATLCVQALRQGLPCGFAANMPVDESSRCVVLPPASGPEREEELLCMMARLRVRFVQSFHAFLDELTELTGADILLLSAYDSDEIQLRIHRLTRQGNTVHLHLLKEAEDDAV